ncbi:hypothetical protein OG563_33310 [Nocardia vinacea]|uniref:Uncharacterized protein n=1 Tax=Nocardia vinacea TaxID=96468 RepID=A0ABZ1YLD6_9NOCA|nr:hypothetical protein [Nocardia vinacea]
MAQSPGREDGDAGIDGRGGGRRAQGTPELEAAARTRLVGRVVGVEHERDDRDRIRLQELVNREAISVPEPGPGRRGVHPGDVEALVRQATSQVIGERRVPGEGELVVHQVTARRILEELRIVVVEQTCRHRRGRRDGHRRLVALAEQLALVVADDQHDVRGDAPEVLAQPRQRRLTTPPVVLPDFGRAALVEPTPCRFRELVEAANHPGAVVELRIGAIVLGSFGPPVRRRGQQHTVRGRRPENDLCHGNTLPLESVSTWLACHSTTVNSCGSRVGVVRRASPASVIPPRSPPAPDGAGPECSR